MFIFILFFFLTNWTEIPPDENQDSRRLLLLHLRSASGTAGPCSSLRLHGTSHDRRYQVSIMMDIQNQSTNVIDPPTTLFYT